MMSKGKFNIVGENIKMREASWSFGGKTARSFTNHVKRSVPFYDTGHDLIARLSDFFIKEKSVCYDLGASTGVLLKKLALRHRHKPHITWIGIDREPNMTRQAKKEAGKVNNIKFVTDDIAKGRLRKSDLIVSYYTIQFVPPHVRQDVFNKIYASLNWGGGFILFEKVRACDARFQDMMQALYTDYKLERGYSTGEIVAKAKSLKGVLEPFSTQGNMDFMKRAGFVDVMSVFKYVCFEGFLAIK